VEFDDFAVHSGALTYDAWEAKVLAEIQTRRYAAVGLHDCYAPVWIEHYPRLLAKLAEIAELWTLDQVAADVTLAAAA